MVQEEIVFANPLFATSTLNTFGFCLHANPARKNQKSLIFPMRLKTEKIILLLTKSSKQL
jgi:hypothetical protein